MDETEDMDHDALKLQLHSIPLNLQSNFPTHESESEEDSDEETTKPSGGTGSSALLLPDQPSTSKQALQSWNIGDAPVEDFQNDAMDQEEEEEELIDLSVDLPPTPLNQLKLNLAYQEVINQELMKIDQQLQENYFQVALINEEEARRKENAKTHVSFTTFKLHFRDANGHPPPTNSEYERQKYELGDLFLADPRAARKWTKDFEKRLETGIEKNARRQLTEPLLSKLEYLQSKYDSSGDEKILEKIEATKREIENCKDKVPDLIADRFHVWDWDSISILELQETFDAMNCCLHWTNVQHSSLKKKKTWTVGETEELKDVIHQNKDRNWFEISSKIKGRTAVSCLSRYQLAISTSFKKKAWTPEEDQNLIRLVKKYRVGNIVPYTRIACHMQGRNSAQLVHRWMKSLDPACKKNKWTPEEDALLIKAVVKYGKQWSRIRNLGLIPGRNDAQIRERYINAIIVNRVGNWSEGEDEKLKEAVEKFGKGNWSQISSFLDIKRTDSQCLRRWRTLEKARKKGKRLQYKRSDFVQSVKKMRDKLATTIVAEQMSVKVETAESGACDENDGDVVEDPSTNERRLIKISARPRHGQADYAQLDILEKLSSNLSSDDILKLYNQLIRARRTVKLKPENKRAEKILIDTISQHYQPMKALSRKAGHPINDHYRRLKIAAEKESTKDLFLYYIKALNINTRSALDAIKKKKRAKAGKVPLEDLLSKKSQDERKALEEVKKTMTGKSMETDDVSSRKSREFARNLYLPLCAPNRATTQAYRRLTKHRETRINVAKKILLDPNDVSTKATTSSTQSVPGTRSDVTDSASGDITAIVRSENTADENRTGDDVTMNDDDGDVTKYKSAELLSDIRSTYKFKIFRSRFNALFTWPAFLSSLVPYVRVKSDVYTQPAVRLRRPAQYPPDVVHPKRKR